MSSERKISTSKHSKGDDDYRGDRCGHSTQYHRGDYKFQPSGAKRKSLESKVEVGKDNKKITVSMKLNVKGKDKEPVLRKKDVFNDDSDSDHEKNVGKKPEEKHDKNKDKMLPVSLKLNVKGKDKEPVLQKTKPSVASVFNDDSDSEQEEMPLECRMKMRNIGRDTVTSAGPNSFNKGKQGFTIDSFRKFEMSMKPRNNMEKQIDYDGK